MFYRAEESTNKRLKPSPYCAVESGVVFSVATGEVRPGLGLTLETEGKMPMTIETMEKIAVIAAAFFKYLITIVCRRQLFIYK